MVEKNCPKCGSRIIVNGKNVEIIASAPTQGFSNITCNECRDWIVSQTG